MQSAKLIPWLLMIATVPNPIRSELRYFTAAARAPSLRTMQQFAEDEIVLGEGPYAGRRFNTSRQPFARLLFAEIDAGRWRRHAITGCVQAGKSLTGYIIPAMYHLFEHRETVIMGLPTMDMAGDKWRNELLPVIQRSRYRDLLPATGSGSRGGTPEAIRFNHGVELKFMSGHGGDEKRSSYTARVVVVTEADKMDTAGESSREAPPIKQIEARTLAFGEAARIYAECTVSIEQGYIWQEYTHGSRSRIFTPCPHCGEYVAMEREHFTGWEEAESAYQAGELGAFFCPACGEAIDDDQRAKMNAAAVLVHDGQEITNGGKDRPLPVRSARSKRKKPKERRVTRAIGAQITGDAPATETLGFRWNAFHNLFWSPRQIAIAAWEARRAADPDDGEREQRQFFWTQPVEPDTSDEFELDPYTIGQRVGVARRGEMPAGFDKLTVGVDISSKKIHWIALAWREGATAHVVDYGALNVYQGVAQRKGIEHAVRVALGYLREQLAEGFQVAGSDQRKRPDMVLIDAGWKAKSIVYGFIAECDKRARKASAQHPDVWWRCAAGRGWGKQYGGRYTHPTKKSRAIRIIGEGYHFVRDAEFGILRGLVNADLWKSFLHARLATTPPDEQAHDETDDGEQTPNAGYVTLPLIADGDHAELCRHWTSEKETRTWDAAKGGEVTQWETVSRANHWFDASYFACVAGHLVGVRIDAPLTAPIDRTPPQDWFSQRNKR